MVKGTAPPHSAVSRGIAGHGGLHPTSTATFSNGGGSSTTPEYLPRAIQSASAAQRREHIGIAAHVHLTGRRAESWLGLWDKGVRASRMHVLEAFISLHQESNASTMEADLGAAAPLLFTRITSWLRLSYKALRGKRKTLHEFPPVPSRVMDVHSKNAPQRKTSPLLRGPEGSGVRSTTSTAGEAGGQSSMNFPMVGGDKSKSGSASRGTSASRSGGAVSRPTGGGSASLSRALGTSNNIMSNHPSSKSTSGPPETPAGLLQHKTLNSVAQEGSVSVDLPQEAQGSSSSTPPPPTSLLLLLQAVIIYVRGASYMTQFVEAGMAAALTDCLECGTQRHSLTMGEADQKNPLRLLSLQERRHIVLLLLYVSNAGRVYREMICEERGLICIFHALQREETEEVCLMMTELFIQLGQGNPRVAPLIHCGLVRLILCHCRRCGAIGPGRSVRDEASSPIPEAEREIGRRLAGYAGLERTVSDHVAFHAARALHYLQITAEEHHFAQCQSGKGVPGLHMSVDMVPIVGLRLDETVNAAAASPPSVPSVLDDPLIAPLTFPEFLDSLMYLTLHDNTRFRVEGSELLALAAKNIRLTRPILSRCFEVLDDDILNISDEDNIDRIARRHRLQLSCGRAAVQIVLSKPMSEERKSLIIKFVALHGAHLSILKYLRLSDSGDAAAVHDCCKALQIIARASHAQQRAALDQKQLSAATSPVLQMGQIVHDAIGDSLYHVLLHEEITEEESFVMLRAAKSSKLLARRSVLEERNFSPGGGAAAAAPSSGDGGEDIPVLPSVALPLDPTGFASGAP